MARISTEEKIKQLEQKIAAIKARVERQKVAKNPAVKPLNAALSYIDKALNSTEDKVLRQSLDEARATVASCLGLLGVTAGAKRGGRRLLTPRRRAASTGDNGPMEMVADANDLLTYLANNPGSSSEVLSKQFSTDANTLRPVMRKLIDDGKVRTKGEKRGTRYFASA